MTSQDRAHTIYNAAKECESLFRECSLHPDLADFEDQLGRFNVWAAKIKALDSSRASLDHRLRESRDTQDLVCRLLEVLQMNLRCGE